MREPERWDIREILGPHPTEAPHRRRGVGSGVVAIVAAFGVTFLLWLFGVNGPVIRGAAAERSDVTRIGGEVGQPGAAVSVPRAVPVEGWAPEGDSRLVLTYTAGSATCAGTLGEPEVVESPESVVVELVLTPPPVPGGAGCDGTVTTRTAEVQLSGPLDDRPVLDGSRTPPAPVPAR